MSRIIAYCGLVCSDCDAYSATQAGDQVALERVAARWRQDYNAPDITAAAVVCDGCQGGEAVRHCGHWYECDIRVCGMARGVANCAGCPDYPCERLTRFWEFAPDLRALLEGLRVEAGS